MFKRIVLTEENYEDILKKIKKTTNNYRMLTRFQVFKEDLDHEEKQYRRGFLLKSFRCVQKNGWIVMKHNFHKLNFFIKATEHFFKVAYDENPESFDGNMYIKMHSLIHMSMGVDSALVLGLGDSIMFLPFGGFVVYTSDSFIHFAYEPLTIYKETFIPDYLFGKIDFNKESTIRDNAIEAQNAIRADEMEKDFMLGYEI